MVEYAPSVPMLQTKKREVYFNSLSHLKGECLKPICISLEEEMLKDLKEIADGLKKMKAAYFFIGGKLIVATLNET